MSVRMTWILSLLLCALVAWELHYIKDLTKDAPEGNCEMFINKLDCKRDVVVVRERQL